MEISIPLSEKEEAWRLVEERAKGPPRWGSRITKKGGSTSDSKLAGSKREEQLKKKLNQLVTPSMTSAPMMVLPCSLTNSVFTEDTGENCLSRTISPAFPSESEGESLPVSPTPSPPSPLTGRCKSDAGTLSMKLAAGANGAVSSSENQRGKLPFKKRRKHGGANASIASVGMSTNVSENISSFERRNQGGFLVDCHIDAPKPKPSPKLPKKKRSKECRNPAPFPPSPSLYHSSGLSNVTMSASSNHQRSFSSTSVPVNTITQSAISNVPNNSGFPPIDSIPIKLYSNIVADNRYVHDKPPQIAHFDTNRSFGKPHVSSFTHVHHPHHLCTQAPAPVTERKVDLPGLSYTAEDETAAAEALVSVVQSVFVAAMEGTKPPRASNPIYKPSDCATTVIVPESSPAASSSGDPLTISTPPHFVPSHGHSMESTLQTSSLLASLQMKQQDDQHQLHDADDKFQTSSPAAAAAKLAALAGSTQSSCEAILSTRAPIIETKQRSESWDASKYVKRNRSMSEPFGTLSGISQSSSAVQMQRHTPTGNFAFIGQKEGDHTMQEILPSMTNFHHPHENPEVLSCKFPHTLPFYQPIYNKHNHVGIYTPAQRKELLEKFRTKRHMRKWNKKVIRYNCRKDLADRRLRVKGRFVKRDENGGHLLPSYSNNDHGPFSSAPDLSASESEEQMKQDGNFEDSEEVVYADASPESPYRRHRRVTVA